MRFSLSRFLQSLVKKAVAVIVALITGGQLQNLLTSWGINVDPDMLTAQLQTAMFMLIEGARVWVSHQQWWEKKVPSWLRALL